MTGSHEVRGSIPLSSTKTNKKGASFIERLLFYWFKALSLKGVGHDVDGVHVDGRIMAGPGAGHVEGFDPVHLDTGGDQRARRRLPLSQGQVDVQHLFAVLQ